MGVRRLHILFLGGFAGLAMMTCRDPDLSVSRDTGATSVETDSGETETSLTYHNFAKNIFDTYCVSCHDETTANSRGFVLTSYDTQDDIAGVFAKRERIKIRVAAKTMPPDGSLSDDDIADLIAWIAAGAPEGKENTEVGEPVAIERPTQGATTSISTSSTTSSSVTATATPSTNHAPTIVITSSSAFDGNAAVLRGANSNITYTAQDADGDTMTIKIELSSDSGVTYSSTIVAAHTSATSYTWAVPGGQTESVKYRIRVTATDSNGATGTDTSAADFGIAASSYTYNGQIQTLLSGSCAPCHSSGGANASVFRWDVYSGSSIGASDKATSVASRTAAGTMPPGGGVSAANVTKLKLWLWQGIPQS